jgi:hypothetical protein
MEERARLSLNATRKGAQEPSPENREAPGPSSPFHSPTNIKIKLEAKSSKQTAQKREDALCTQMEHS